MNVGPATVGSILALGEARCDTSRVTAARRIATLSAWAWAAVFAALAWSRRTTVDDAFIDFRVVDNLLHGYGPVYNVSERVEAYTNPLWVALLTLASPLFGHGPSGRAHIEETAVVLGIALAAAALALACLASSRLSVRGSGHFAWPAGALVVLALAPFWDFAGCGLETGLVLFWLAGCFYLLAGEPRASGWRSTAIALAIGAGPLVRPDLTLTAALFLGVLWACQASARQRVASAATAVAPVVAYQVFRMGYFACLLPNTALAKEAGLANWSAGWGYLRDFAEPYQLGFPVALLLLGVGAALVDLRRRGRSTDALLVAAAAAGALLQGLYVVRLGGDFMHARMLLPALFALVLPVATIVGTPPGWALLLIPWAFASAIWGRCPYAEQSEGTPAIENERAFYASRASVPNPVAAEDFLPKHNWAADGVWLAEHASGPLPPEATEPHGGLFTPGWQFEAYQVDIQPWVQASVVAARFPIGIIGFLAGPRTHVCDARGIADPLASRVRLASRGGKAGHEKTLLFPWCEARCLAPGADGTLPRVDASEVRRIRALLHCGDLATLQAAVTEPLTWSRFWRNVALAPALTRLRFDPDKAEGDEGCQ